MIESSKDFLFRLMGVTLSRPGGEPILRDLDWTVREKETWALVGPGGSGKTTLAETLLGRHRLISGRLTWPMFERMAKESGETIWPSEVITMVGFREESRLFSYRDLYYQQRFEFAEEAKAPTVGDFLSFGNNSDSETIAKMAKRLGIEKLLGQSFLTLSNGETRRTRIARALLQSPQLLILDDPFAGLDAIARVDLDQMLGKLVHEGTRLLLLTNPQSVPDWITHLLELGSGHSQKHSSLTFQGKLQEWREYCAKEPVTLNGSREVPAENFVDFPTDLSREVIGLEDVTVKMANRTILDGVTWTVREGERWALVGPNGSGKTTLLSLLCGDHPQAFCNTVRLFGSQRGSGETIWEIKKRVGLVSPELHLYFSEPISAWNTAATGFFDVLTRRSVSTEQGQVIDDLFRYFGLDPIKEKPFSHLSTGQQRLVLLVRALVKKPPLLLLDEPFQGLDGESIRLARAYLDEKLHPKQTLIFVTHRPGEQPDCVNHRLRLEHGKVVEKW